MKIAINAMLLGDRRSGVELAILNFLRAANTLGAHTYDAYVPARTSAPLPPSHKVRFQHAGAGGSNRLLRIGWEQLALPRAVQRDGCDLVHAPGYLAPLSTRLPVVLTVYDVMALRRPELCRRANRWHYRLMLPLSIRKARTILVPSEFTAHELEQAVPGSARKTHVIPLAVADDLLQTPGPGQLDGARTRLHLPPHFILSVGRAEPKKNIPALLEVFASLRASGDIAHDLVLAGPDGHAGTRIDWSVRRLGLGDCVHRIGHIASDDLGALYHLADLFVFPSLYEGFGLPPLEAMACGTPVVCSRAGALGEVVGDAALKVSPSDTATLAHAMRQALADPALRTRLVNDGHRRARATTWHDVARRTDVLYADTLRKATRSRTRCE